MCSSEQELRFWIDGHWSSCRHCCHVAPSVKQDILIIYLGCPPEAFTGRRVGTFIQQSRLYLLWSLGWWQFDCKLIFTPAHLKYSGLHGRSCRVTCLNLLLHMSKPISPSNERQFVSAPLWVIQSWRPWAVKEREASGGQSVLVGILFHSVSILLSIG